MWPDTPFEKRMKMALKKAGSRGEILAGDFVKAKSYLCDNIYEEIKRTEPDLSDHGFVQ